VRFDEWTSLPAMFFEQAQAGGDKPFMWAKHEGQYQPLSWREIANQVRHLAAGLGALGMEGGDRVVLVSENRPEWGVADIAIMSAGGITVPAYTTNTTRDHRHILSDSGAKGVIVSTRALAQQLLPAVQECRTVEFIIALDDVAAGAFDTPIHSWVDVLAQGEAASADIDGSVASLRRTDVACLIYTSGTGGNPKGVMLRHESVMLNCKGACALLQKLGIGNDIFLSFLPLSHAYEHTAGLFFPISIDAQIYYAESVEKLSENLLEARPTVMISVPRLYDVLRARILSAVNQRGGLKAHLFRKAVALGTREHEHPGSLNPAYRVLNRLLDRLVRRKVQQRFGGRLKAMISGGAALNPEVGMFFTALGVRLLQGYGQTEAGPVISCNEPDSVNLNTVGPPLLGVDLKIADDGEILVSGPLVMEGYWNDSDGTAAALRDGWLHTGDIGRIDDAGRIRITDRKKDIIVLSGGDNLSPQRVEGMLTLQPEIAQAMVIGDSKRHLAALIVPDDDFIKVWCETHGKAASLDALHNDPAFVKSLSACVDRANIDLSPIERVKKFLVARDAFTVNNQQMTPTLKVRRHKVADIYGEDLNALY